MSSNTAISNTGTKTKSTINQDIEITPAEYAELEAMPTSRLVTGELLPTKPEERHMTAPSMFWLWVGLSVLLTTFTMGASLYPSLSVAVILIAMAVGNLVVCAILAMTGDIGVRYGLTFSVYLRACYGTWGTHIPSIIRALPAIFWLGFQSFLGATAINAILVLLTNGAWPGTLSYQIGILIVFLAVQCFTTARGVGAIDWFEKIAAPLMLVLGLFMVYYILQHFNMTVGQVISTPSAPVPDGQMKYSFGYAVTSATGYWATMSLNILDFTRYYKGPKGSRKGNWLHRNKGLIISQTFGIVITITLFAFIGATAMVATGLWNPVDVIVSLDAPLIITLIALVISMLAQWSTNIGANILPPANIFANAFAPRVNFAIGCILSGVIALLMQTWRFGDMLVTVFAYISAGLGAIAGTMVVDYYILRGGILKVVDLYKEKGEYTYARGFNPAALIAYAIGFVCGILVIDWGFLTSLAGGAIAYFLLMRFWGAKKYKQTDIIARFNIQ